jgi:hypothetical protein
MELQRDTQRERLFYIDFLAFFIGQVARKDLVTRFGISEPAATKDLSLYAEMAPAMLEYDLRQRCYVYAGGAPLFTHDVDQSLYSLSGERALALNSEHAKRLPSSVQASIKRQVPTDLVAALTRAMYQRKQISATYTSLDSGATERILSPVALVHDGLRWHIRCFNHAKDRFTDFNLARFLTVAEGGPSEKLIDQDPEWTKEVVVILGPHPRAEHPETIRFDYVMEGDTKTVTMSLCLVPYFLRHWHIDTTPTGTKNPKEHQLFLLNRQELIDQRVLEWVFDDDVPEKAQEPTALR